MQLLPERSPDHMTSLHSNRPMWQRSSAARYFLILDNKNWKMFGVRLQGVTVRRSVKINKGSVKLRKHFRY